MSLPRKTVATDTEGWSYNPWGGSLSIEPGEGIVFGPDPASIAAVQQCFDEAELILVHSILHDLEVLRAMGISLPVEKCIDTMICAFLLVLEPQGLKPLSYRHAGMTMFEYEEITHDAAEMIARRHLQTLWDLMPGWLKYRKNKAQLVWEAKVKANSHLLKNGAPRSKPKGAKPLLTDYAKAVQRCLLSDKPRKQWHDQDPAWIYQSRSYGAGSMREATLDDIDPAVAVSYAGGDAVGTYAVGHALLPKIRAAGLEPLLKLEMSVVPLLDRMQHVGMQIDKHHFYRLSRQIDQWIAKLDRVVEKRVGHPVNCNSGDQVAVALFDEMHLHTEADFEPWLTPSGERYSTEDKILEALRGAHKVVRTIINRRELTKVKGTYCDKIPELARLHPNGTWRLHPNLRVTRVPTGRLAANAPNVLAIPKHTALGQLIRRGFVAGPGRVLGSWDLSQIEFRVFAHLTQDPLLLKIFREGGDPHADTAYRLLKAPRLKKDQDESKHRFPAKKINFGIVMGMTGVGLCQQLHMGGQLQWTIDECQALIDAWYSTYHHAWAWVCRQHAEVRQKGYTTDTLSGRRFYLNVTGMDRRNTAAALREAQALPVQGGAQTVVKHWEANVWQLLADTWRECPEVYCEPWLQIHDDLTLEMDADFYPVMHGAMLASLPQLLDVPTEADGGKKTTWAKTH